MKGNVIIYLLCTFTQQDNLSEILVMIYIILCVEYRGLSLGILSLTRQIFWRLPSTQLLLQCVDDQRDAQFL